MVSFNVPFLVSLLAGSIVAAPVSVPQASAPLPESGKRGLAYNDPSALQPFKGTPANSWNYNWGSSSDGSSGAEYVPMLWGPKFFNSWNPSSVLGSGNKCILGFNEPDHGEQASMSPQSAAEAFKQYLTPLAGKLQLGSPGVTNGGGAMGLNWMQSFLDSCTDCKIDFLAIHWYSPAGEVEGFKNHISQAIELGRSHGIDKVWITEFQGLGDDQAQAEFIKQVVPWLDANPGVARYSYFKAENLVSGGQLNTVGKAYAES
ncbi:predicted protein [Uncinocarpus reesii 1704]|uniref:Asl1-like glycosyl hydrolase catalytic domain-containing protein n=1 Tax=Uncinocarpus reesii (strain UAMH 1704) TaxID=336963 RepID=C4JFX5_UNCRE|nr:uncharacterized protein UREG_01055 [Uncinocarpus reesii 1704]EEP76206.1 predicted protein [Uncinocarpus reesii 1704]